MNFSRNSTKFHNRKAETSTFRIKVSPSLSDPENGFSLYPQVLISTCNPCETLLLRSRNPVSTNTLAHSVVVKMLKCLATKTHFRACKDKYYFSHYQTITKSFSENTQKSTPPKKTNTTETCLTKNLLDRLLANINEYKKSRK